MVAEVVSTTGHQMSSITCRACRKALPEECFGTRKFRGAIVPVKACFQCMARTNELQRATTKTPKARASRAKTIEKHKQTDGYKASIEQYNKSEKGRARKKRANASEAQKRGKAKHRASEKCAQTTAKYKASDHYKKLRAAEYERIHSDPGRHLEHAVGVVMGHMLHGKRDKSQKVLEASGFKNREELRAHLELTFDTGMTFENHGRYVKGGPPVWHIGHRIAKWHFDPNTHPEDMKRCWSPANIFAQWGIDNLRAKVRFPKEEELLSLKDCWPTAWGSELPTLEARIAMEEKVFASCGKYER